VRFEPIRLEIGSARVDIGTMHRAAAYLIALGLACLLSVMPVAHAMGISMPASSPGHASDGAGGGYVGCDGHAPQQHADHHSHEPPASDTDSSPCKLCKTSVCCSALQVTVNSAFTTTLASGYRSDPAPDLRGHPPGLLIEPPRV